MRLSLILLLTCTLSAIGQNATKHSFNFEKAATIDLSEKKEDWHISLQHLEAPKPGVDGLRAELMAKKQEIMQRYSKTRTSGHVKSTGPTPSVGHSFEGNAFNGIPNDNDMAISRDGKIVSVTNSRIYMYDEATENQIDFTSLHLFSSDLEILGSKYDPKVIYDPNNDRFVIIFLSGYTWQTSKIVIGFSQTSDPTGAWNLYYLPGNPLANETWSDYPVVGISGKDLYIGINTFLNGSENNSGFVETCLWQVGLKEGYIGFDLNTNYYSDILPQNRAIFNICPIQAAAESEAENMYLLSNRNTDAQNDTVFLLEVTGRVSNPNAQLEVTILQADQPYILPVPADQTANQFLDTNDGRVLGGYLLNNRIYYVQSCTDPNNGRAAIYHGVIDDVNGSPSMVSRIYSQPDMDYGYPNISWTGQSLEDEQSIISFNHSAEGVFAGFSAMHIDAGLNASNRVEVQEGYSIINVLGGTLERWGDYSGSQRMYNQPGVVWAVGTFANGSNGYGTWIAELRSPDAPNSLSEELSVAETNIYPNPFLQDITVKFTLKETLFLRLELIDVNGKLVQTLLEDRVKAGDNQITFNGELLAPGTYFVRGSTNGEQVFSKQIIKQ
jgi:hypothetical protein